MIYLNGEEVIFQTFPNGEVTIVESSFFHALEFGNVVTFKYTNDSDLIKLMFVKRYLDTTHEGHPNGLIISYMPYSRMDRSEGESIFTLKYVADFINSLNFDQVDIIEPHSDVTPALVDRSKSLYINFDLVKRVKEMVGFNEDTDYLVFPDAGASKRYNKMEAKNVLVGHKNRDFKTGEIKELVLVGDTRLAYGATAIIVDDLSSYGGTFVRTAERLRKEGFTNVYLLVCHSENSIFKGKLFEHVDKVFTTDTILTEHTHWQNAKIKEEKLHVFKIGELLDGNMA